MSDPIDDFFRNMMKQSMQNASSYNNYNELECINLYQNGWKQDGLDRLPNSEDIVVHWVKGPERRSIHLTFAQQSRWIRLIEHKIKTGEIKI